MAKILCIEDEPDLRADIVEELRDAGYATWEASNGVSGLELLLRIRPDLVICDVTMPEMSGIELFNHLRREHPSLNSMRFIFLSALDNVVEHISPGLQADGYLTKPLDFTTLLNVVGDNVRALEGPARMAMASGH